MVTLAEASDRVGARSRDHERSRELWILAAVLLAPLAVFLVRLWLTRNIVSTSDTALIELRTRDVGGLSTPLVGPYSRYGWNHPGPLLFYLLAVPYRLLGGSSLALLAGSTLINGAAILGALWLLWRRARLAGVLSGSLVLAVLLHSSLFVSAWNPYMVVIPMFTLAVCTWSIMCGDYWLLPVTVAIATFEIQTHVGTALAAGSLTVVSFVAVAINARRGHVKAASRLLLISAGLGLAMWLPPIVEQFQGGGGNIGHLWSFFTTSHKTVGLRDGARLVASQLSLRAPWVTGHERITGDSVDPAWTLPTVFVLLVSALVMAVRRRDRDAIILDAIALGFAGVAWISVARIVDDPFSYLLTWTWIVGALAWLAIGVTVLRAIRLRTRLIFAAGALIVVAVSVSTTAGASPNLILRVRSEREARSILPAAVAAARHLPQPEFVTVGTTTYPSADLEDSLLLALVKGGVRAGIARRYETAVGQSHVLNRFQARTILTIIQGPLIGQAMQDPHYRLLASYDPHTTTTEERDFLTRTIRTLATLNEKSTLKWILSHYAEWNRYQTVAGRDGRIAVFAMIQSSSS